jgi:hypothetical protein
MTKILFKKLYSDESLYDSSRDMADWLDSESYILLPETKDGFKRGSFEITITWTDDDEWQ